MGNGLEGAPGPTEDEQGKAAPICVVLLLHWHQAPLDLPHGTPVSLDPLLLIGLHFSLDVFLLLLVVPTN